MKRYNPEIHHRNSIRLKGYDYSSGGMYFVTVCSQGDENLFGGITDNVMDINDAGMMVERLWLALPERFSMVALDEFTVMPNHFHGIIAFRTGEPRVRPFNHGDHKQGDHKDRPYGTHDNSLGRIIQAFKSMTTVEYVKGVEHSNWPPFPGRLWHRNYYERIIRDEGELNNIREYIINNPARWAEDKENQASETQ